MQEPDRRKIIDHTLYSNRRCSTQPSLACQAILELQKEQSWKQTGDGEVVRQRWVGRTDQAELYSITGECLVQKFIEVSQTNPDTLDTLDTPGIPGSLMSTISGAGDTTATTTHLFLFDMGLNETDRKSVV